MSTTTFKPNTKSLQKRILLRSMLIFLINLSFLIYSVYMTEPDKKISNLLIFSVVMVIVLVFLYRNYKKQLNVLSDNYVEIDGHKLKQYFSENMCNEVNLKKLVSITQDSFRGYDRLTLVGKDHNVILLNMEDLDTLKNQIETLSNKKTEYKSINYKPLYVKALVILLPSIVGLILHLFVPAANVHIKLLYLIANVNLFFLAYGISDKSMPNGFPFQLARRMMIVLAILLGFQVYLYFFKQM